MDIIKPQNTNLELMLTDPHRPISVISHNSPFATAPDKSHRVSASVSDYLIAIKKALKYLLLFALLGAVLAVIIAFLINPTYTSKASIKIETGNTRILDYDVDTSRPPSYINDDVFYNTQYKLLRNRDLANAVIERLELEEHLKEEKTFAAPIYALKNWLKIQLEHLKSFIPELNKTSNEANKLEELFFEKLSINPVRRSRIIDISYTAQDPQLSKEILEMYISRFISLQYEKRLQATDEAKVYLSSQIENSRKNMEDAEQKLLAYAKGNKIVDTQSDVSVIASNISLLNEAYIKAKSRRIDAESQYQNKKNISTLLNAGADPVIQAKKQELSSLQAEYRSKLKIFKPAYPEMLTLKQQIEQLESFIRQESKNVGNNTSKNMEANYIASLEEERKLQKEISRLENDLMKFYESSIGYAALKRDVDTSRELYEGLLQRQKEISVSGPVPGDNISIVDSPSLPQEKNGFGYAKMAALGALAGLFLMTIYTLLKEMLMPVIRNEQDLKALSGKYPLLTSIPKVKPSLGMFRWNNLSIKHAYDTRASESLRYLRTTLQFGNSNGQIPKVIHITSPNPSEGKSTTAIFLATSLASVGKKVLLIDGDLRRPSLHKKLKLDNSQGFTNYFYDSEIKTHKCYLKDPRIFFMAVAAGPAIPDPVDALSSQRFNRLISKSREVFDHIIIDSPPVLGMADAVVISNIADCSLLIVKNNETRKKDALIAIERLEEGQGRIAGVICNQTNRSYSKNYYNSRYNDGRRMLSVN